MRENEEPLDPVRTRFLGEVWWETRERRGSRRVMRGWIRVLPDGPKRAFSQPWQLATLIAVASRHRDRRQDERGDHLPAS